MPDVPVNHTGQPIFATAGRHRGALNALARKVDAAFWQNKCTGSLWLRNYFRTEEPDAQIYTALKG